MSYFRDETADVDLLADRGEYPLDTQERINVYNAKIISIMDAINAKKVPRFEDPDSETGLMSIGDMSEAYREKAKTLILRLYGMYKPITTGEDDPNFGEGKLRNKLFAFNGKYKANLENHFDWWEQYFGAQIVGTHRRWGGKKRTHKRKTHVNKSRKNKKKRGNK